MLNHPWSGPAVNGGRETGNAITVIKTTGKDTSIWSKSGPFSLRLSVYFYILTLFIQGSSVMSRGFFHGGRLHTEESFYEYKLETSGENGACTFFFYVCGWEGVEEVYGYEHKSTVIRHNNHINIWEISAQISGWTCAGCVRAHSLSFSKYLSLYAKTHHKSIKPITPPPHPSAYFLKCLRCVENKHPYTTSCPHPNLRWATKKQQLSLLFSLPLSQRRKPPPLLEGQSWTVVWEKVKERTDKSL